MIHTSIVKAGIVNCQETAPLGESLGVPLGSEMRRLAARFVIESAITRALVFMYPPA